MLCNLCNERFVILSYSTDSCLPLKIQSSFFFLFFFLTLSLTSTWNPCHSCIGLWAAREVSTAGQDCCCCPLEMEWDGRLPVCPAVWLGKQRDSVSHTGPGANAALLVPGCVPGQRLESGCRDILGWACEGEQSPWYLLMDLRDNHKYHELW